MTGSRRISVLLFEGVNALDVAGPLEAFSSVPPAGASRRYATSTIALDAGPMRAESGLRLCPDMEADRCPGADLLVVPGGRGVREPETLARLAGWLRDNHGRFDRIAAVCTGAYALAESGLVDGRTLTTHWAHAADLRRRYPQVRVADDHLFLRDGRFYSSGGVTAGIDLALDVIQSDFGPKAAADTARQLVVFLRRTGSQSQFSEPLKLQATSGALSETCLWAANNLGASVSVERLAERANLSVRQFTRRFRREFGASPARYVRNLRLDMARTSLADEGSGLEQIAHLVGFHSVDGFRRAFERRFGLGPAEYRRRFRQSGVRP